MKMWREDVHDICKLTSVKLDTYLVIAAVLGGIALLALTEGRLQAMTSRTSSFYTKWLMCLHAFTGFISLMYCILSIWYANQGIVAAKGYETQLRTQDVRLPIPTWEEMESSRTYASSFERSGGRHMFRVPFAQGSQHATVDSNSAYDEPSSNFPHCSADDARIKSRDCTASPRKSDTMDPWGLERANDNVYELDGAVRKDVRQLKHMQILKEVSQYWMAYDAFSRVCLTLSMLHLVYLLAYFNIIYTMVFFGDASPACLCSLLLIFMALAILRFDLSVSGLEFLSLFCLQFPACIAVIVTLCVHDRGGMELVVEVCGVIAFVCSGVSMFLLLYILRITETESGTKVPLGFRSCLYLDVFGWIKEKAKPSAWVSGQASSERDAESLLPGRGPAIRSVQYTRAGAPIASGITQQADARPHEILKPDSFMPHWDSSRMNLYVKGDPGYTFQTVTILLGVLWFIGAVMTYSSLNILSVRNFWSDETTTLLADVDSPTIQTSWPHMNVHPHSIAYDPSSGVIVAASHLNTYFAILGGNLDDEVISTVTFTRAPSCKLLDGEDLQDVSLHCHEGACSAYILHRYGTLVSTCPVTDGEGGIAAPRSVKYNISQSWLETSEQGEEIIESFIVSDKCSGKASNSVLYLCAYLMTSSGRILEVIEHGGTWYPKRHIATDASNVTNKPHLLVMNERHLAVQHAPVGSLSIFDLWSQRYLGQWALPKPAIQWDGLISASTYIHVLSTKGRLPSIHKFQMPRALKTTSVKPNSVYASITLLQTKEVNGTHAL